MYSETECFPFLNRIYFYVQRLAKALSRGKHEGRIYYPATRHVWGMEEWNEIICDSIVRPQDSQTSRVTSHESSKNFFIALCRAS